MEYRIIANKIVVGITSSGKMFKFDIEDFDKVKQYSWSFTNGYVMAYDKNLKKNIYLHQLIMNRIGVDDGLVVDHIDRNKSNNRRNNLRIVTYQDNSRNCSLSKRNTSGITGVTWNSGKDKWQSTICIKGKLKMLGMSKDLDFAIELRKKAEEDFFK